MVRSVDLARHMGFSKPSISHAVGGLKNGGFLIVDDDGFLHLTAIGQEVAEKIYERHRFFMEQLVAAGVDLETAGFKLAAGIAGELGAPYSFEADEEQNAKEMIVNG